MMMGAWAEGGKWLGAAVMGERWRRGGGRGSSGVNVGVCLCVCSFVFMTIVCVDSCMYV
jgi:hypothetical protein